MSRRSTRSNSSTTACAKRSGWQPQVRLKLQHVLRNDTFTWSRTVGPHSGRNTDQRPISQKTSQEQGAVTSRSVNSSSRRKTRAISNQQQFIRTSAPFAESFPKQWTYGLPRSGSIIKEEGTSNGSRK